MSNEEIMQLVFQLNSAVWPNGLPFHPAMPKAASALHELVTKNQAEMVQLREDADVVRTLLRDALTIAELESIVLNVSTYLPSECAGNVGAIVLGALTTVLLSRIPPDMLGRISDPSVKNETVL